MEVQEQKELSKEQTEAVEKWAGWGAWKMEKWCKSNGADYDPEWERDFLLVGVAAAMRRTDLCGRDLERWLFRSIWHEGITLRKKFPRSFQAQKDALLWLQISLSASAQHYQRQLVARSDLWRLRQELSEEELELLLLIAEEGSVTGAAQRLQQRDPKPKALVTYRAYVYALREKARQILGRE